MKVIYKSKTFLLIAVVLLFSFVVPAAYSHAAYHGNNDGLVSKSKFQHDVKKGDPVPKSSIQSYVNKMQPGWNLGNTFDSTGSDTASSMETSWGNPKVTKKLMYKIAAQGFHSIRIPITWDKHVGPSPSYTIDPAYLNRIQQVVNWALDAHLYVIINMHHDSWLWVNQMTSDQTSHAQVLSRYDAIWSQIANKFKNESTKLSFESINEPQFVSSSYESATNALNDLNTSFDQIVRATGGKNSNRPLILPTVGCTPSQDYLNSLSTTISNLHDPNIIAEVHYYGYWPFSTNIAGTTTFDQTTKQDMSDTFDRVYSTMISKGIPVILGEYGLLGFDKSLGTVEHGEMLKFFEYLGYYAHQKGLTTMLWDNGQHFNRTTFQWSDPELYNVLKAGFKGGRSSTASTDLIYVQKGQPVSDTTVTLNLHENRFTGISFEKNGNRLKRGKDYILKGDQLTLKASLLSKLTASGNFGQDAKLTVHFSRGANWYFRVIYADTPILSSVTGNTGSFAIPTQFNGDQLATMQATYVDAPGYPYPGPQNWTSYKEFDSAFYPLYDKNEIQLPQSFFDNVNVGQQVCLKFYFWSGKVLNYYITKNADGSVVGSTMN